ncbi:TetR-like C-terminal domain-containing protein [Nonomuraea antimicrobica]
MGVRAGELLVAAVTAERGGDSPQERLAAVARGYVRFAAGHRALFEALFGALTPVGEPELERAAQPVKAAFQSAAMSLSGGDQKAAEALGMAVAATAHGHAGLLHLGMFGEGAQAVDTAVRHAAAATLALVAGRAALTL